MKTNKSIGPSTEATKSRDLQRKRRELEKKLDLIKDYKRLLAADGMVPDNADKDRESHLIQQLLGLDKDQKRMEGSSKWGQARAKPPKKVVKGPSLSVGAPVKKFKPKGRMANPAKGRA